MLSRMRGFTLIELMVALALLALLVSAAAPTLQLTAKRNKEQELKRALWQIRDAIDAYKLAVDNGQIKKSIADSGYPPNLQILVEGVENQQSTEKKKLHFLRSIPRDPFATDLNASNVETWGKRSYNMTTDGDDSREDVYDVYSFSNEIGINQQPYREW